MGHTVDRCYLFEVCKPLQDFRKIYSMNQDTLFIWKGLWKHFGLPHKFGGTGFHKISGVVPMVLARFLETQIWSHLHLNALSLIHI